jgi:hypothetical protein
LKIQALADPAIAPGHALRLPNEPSGNSPNQRTMAMPDQLPTVGGDAGPREAVPVILVDASGNLSDAGAPLQAGTDRSGAIAAGGTAQQLAAANTVRRSLKGQNISAGDLWINENGGTAAADTAGSYKVPAGATFSVGTNRAVSIVGALTGQKFSATEV